MVPAYPHVRNWLNLTWQAVLRVPKAEVIEAHPVVGDESERGDLGDMFRSANHVAAAIPW